MPSPKADPLNLPRSARACFAKITEIINGGAREFPAVGKYNGSGAPGNFLEYLLGIKENNADSPDLLDWEIKFHGGSSLLTLFHKDPEPRGVVGLMVHDYGWDDEHGRISFRHTISGQSPRGFRVVNEADRITIKNELKEGATPFWIHNTILNALSSKLRRLIVVQGEMLKEPRRVVYREATAFWEPDIIGFCKAISDGVILIDFDARTKLARGSTIRNHGTKFRIEIDDLSKIYANQHKIIIENKCGK